MKMTTLILLILFVSGGDCDSHSLRYACSGVSSPGSGLPEYSLIGYVDDREIAIYNSDTRRFLPKLEWMKKMEAEYWAEYTGLGHVLEHESKDHLGILMGQFNQTGGMHSYQSMSGCELRDDGSTAGYSLVAYDGRQFTYLDTQNELYIPTMNEAKIITQRWNNPDVRRGESRKNYLQNQCMEELKQIIEYGREDLEKIVRPEVKVWGRHQSDGATRLQCLVYGFHPRAVDVRWMKNGVDYVISHEMTPILPHPDGTYQMRVGVEVPTTEDTYACHVEHSSLGNETFRVVWDPNTEYKTNIPMIIGVVVVVVLLSICAIFGVVIFKRR